LAERHPERAVRVVEGRPGSLLLERSNLFVIFQNHDPTFFINMTPGSKAYPRINTTTSWDL
jgi:hypothetical protein